MYPPQRKLSSFSQHNRGTSARDCRGLNLEGKRFVTDCKKKRGHLSGIVSVVMLPRSLVSEMDHGAVVCSLAEVCSFPG